MAQVRAQRPVNSLTTPQHLHLATLHSRAIMARPLRPLRCLSRHRLTLVFGTLATLAVRSSTNPAGAWPHVTFVAHATPHAPPPPTDGTAAARSLLGICQALSARCFALSADGLLATALIHHALEHLGCDSMRTTASPPQSHFIIACVSVAQSACRRTRLLPVKAPPVALHPQVRMSLDHLRRLHVALPHDLRRPQMSHGANALSSTAQHLAAFLRLLSSLPRHLRPRLLPTLHSSSSPPAVVVFRAAVIVQTGPSVDKSHSRRIGIPGQYASQTNSRLVGYWMNVRSALKSSTLSSSTLVVIPSISTLLSAAARVSASSN